MTVVSSCLAVLIFGVGPQSKVPSKIVLPFEKYVLSNGLKVILHVDKSLPVATINTWFRVGSRDEAPGRSGFAHLYEHLMFMGTFRVPDGQFDQIMEKAGGFNNASTTADRTNYYSFGPAGLLPTLLWLDADRLEALDDAMDQKKLDLQREVVKNERRQNVENVPYGKGDEMMSALMYPAGHPYSWSVIGSHQDLSAASVEDVKSFFRAFYVPNNASLVVAGDFDPEVIKPLISKYFGTLPLGNQSSTKMPAPFTYSTRKVTLTDTVTAARTLFAYHTAPKATRDDLVMSVIANILSNGLASRLQIKLVQQLGVASEVSAYQDSMELGSQLIISAIVAPGKTQAELDLALDTVLVEFGKSGPTPSELRRVAAGVEAIIGQTLQSIDQKADMMNQFEHDYGTPDYFQQSIDDVKSIKPDEVKRVFAKYVRSDRRLELRTLPETKIKGLNPRDTQPSLGVESAWMTPKPVEVMGVEYWQNLAVPVWTVQVEVEYGGVDREGTLGRSVIAANWMARAGLGLTVTEFQSKLDELGASVSASYGSASTTFVLSVPVSNASAATKLFGAILNAPSLILSDFNDLKEESISDLQQENDRIGSVAGKVLRREFFGQHPYAQPARKLEDVEKLTSEAVKQSVAEIMAAARRTYAAGPVDPITATAMLQASGLLGRPTGKMLVAPTPEFVPQKIQRVVIVDRPGSVQTSIGIALPAMNLGDPNSITMEAVQVALGGSFTSRLNQNLREDKGYTYGAGASYNVDKFLGYVLMSASVRADVTGPSLSEFLKEISRANKGDFTVEEAGKASKQMRTALIRNFSNVGAIVNTAANLAHDGQTLADLDRRLTIFPSITAAEMNSLSRRIFDINSALIVLVGDKALITEQLKGLGLSEPTIVLP